jgi:hypothetical protein
MLLICQEHYGEMKFLMCGEGSQNDNCVVHGFGSSSRHFFVFIWALLLSPFMLLSLPFRPLTALIPTAFANYADGVLIGLMEFSVEYAD